MSEKSLKPCSELRCPNLTRSRYCDDHKRNIKGYDRHRGSAAQRGYDSKWRKARTAYLMKHPFCVECNKVGVIAPATVVDHIIPHKGDKKLFWDSKNNWQSLCEMHHNRKTKTHDMGKW
ncbi:HNH endonuclease [Metabacillus litoralis]|uniref:HNH endonuclease n=1 Tax=Metabacillus litoralis TaxID=152268 RepID=UPI00203A4F37|nr:HNH endonuclease signature motif containing protein [Metabacillus litoralis]MCM3411240.1 HNH endonuclease [Metabacillus litoralis]